MASLPGGDPSSHRQPKLVSVVMPVLNGAQTLTEQLQALAAQDYKGSWELVVVDNGSTDDSTSIVTAWENRLPRVRYVDASGGRGISRACNIGARGAQGDFLMFCHQDDIADPGWIKEMVVVAAGCDMIGGRMEYESLNTRVVLSWRRQYAAHRLPIAMGFLPFAVGANIGIWTNVFLEAQGWNEELVRGGEDIEFCWRVQLAGYRFCFAPDALMAFRYRTDIAGLRRQFYHFGLTEPWLYREFRAHGVPATSLLTAFRTWLWLLLHLGNAFGNEEERGIWARKAAYRWGRLRGSIRHRCFYL